ncbi:hypothetical protein SPBR_05434 [Sporothrix brasiliensis 5110]|uniref:Uncharacterized protein n=1 Tax=Sporothrix brasiliensis 5110 TaxID=1398154 RepID=A0A0C2F7Z3_9PEZI|nr:uncharacterized protein SPBR_05434 [Sporothrix brasiliensis 5110]KIH87143.1 hypothetical protein SPBR_05434 [Sporothrix brasiliensis 5110]
MKRCRCYARRTSVSASASASTASLRLAAAHGGHCSADAYSRNGWNDTSPQTGPGTCTLCMQWAATAHAAWGSLLALTEWPHPAYWYIQK